MDAEGQPGEGVGVEPDAVQLAEGPQQLGVHGRGVVELELVVVMTRPSRADAATAQQHGGLEANGQALVGDAAVLPPGDAGREQDRAHAAVARQLAGHRSQRSGPAAGGAVQGTLAEQHGQRRGAPREQCGEPRRVGVAEVQRLLDGASLAEEGVGQPARGEGVTPVGW